MRLFTKRTSIGLGVMFRKGGATSGLYTEYSAVSINNEEDSSGTWTSIGLGAPNTFESQDTVANSKWAFLAESNSNPSANARFEYDFTSLDGYAYYVDFDARHVGSGGDWSVLLLTNAGATTLGSQAFTSVDTSWNNYTLRGRSDGTSLLIRGSETSATNDGGLYFDNVAINYDPYNYYDGVTETLDAAYYNTNGATTVRKRAVGAEYHIDITLTSTGFAGVENVDWTNLVIRAGQTANFRVGVRDGEWVVDCEITPTGFAGVEDVDWEFLRASAHPSSVRTEFRDGVRNGGYVIDQALTATGFDGNEDTDWINLSNYRPI
jgi:hypothetical protein